MIENNFKILKTEKVGVISGKGGVGKTTLTASLSFLANKDKHIQPFVLDADVDAPNLSVLLPPDKGGVVKLRDEYATLKAELIKEKCVHCKRCVEEHFCEFNAISWNYQEGIPKIKYLSCEGCGACRVLCPEKAFEIEKVKSGEIIAYESLYGFHMVYGRTVLGSTTSGKLVSEVKNFALNHSEYENSNLLLIDGPPGIGCPVIAALSGLDYVIAITEPTPSGLHDLIRAIEVVEQFNIPFGIVVNKFDIESPFKQKFISFLNETNYDVIGQIPFDSSIPEAMSFTKTVVEYAPESKATLAIKEIYSRLKENLYDVIY